MTGFAALLFLLTAGGRSFYPEICTNLAASPEPVPEQKHCAFHDLLGTANEPLSPVFLPTPIAHIVADNYSGTWSL